MDTLEKLLIDLNSAVDDADALGTEAQNIIANIESLVLQSEFLELDVDYVFYFICESSSPPSILHFLNASIRLKPYIKAKCSALKFLGKLIKFVGSDVEPYADSLLTTCTNQLKIEDSNEVKAASVIPLRQLFHLYKHGLVLDPIEIGLQGLYSLLIDEFRMKKATSGTKYQVLVTLGHLIYVYPVHDATIAVVDVVLDLAVSSLNKNFSVGKSTSRGSSTSPDLTVIAGAFSCLDLCMTHHEDKLQGSVNLWKQLLMALSGINQDSVFRYGMVGKALRLIKNHSGLFRDLIGVNIDTSYRLTVACFFSDKTACKKHAEEALLALLRQFSFYITQQTESVTSATEQSLQTIMQEFLGYLDGASESSSKCIILAVKGLTVLAPVIADGRWSVGAIPVTQGSASPSNLVDKLIATCEYLILRMQSANDSLEVDPVGSEWRGAKLGYDTKSILRKAQFLIAIVSNLGVYTDSTLPLQTYSYIVGLACDVAAGYSRLWGSSQAAARQSLCLFVMGMACVKCPPFPSALDEAVAQVVPCLLFRTMSRPDVGENVELFAVDSSSGDTDGRLHYTYSFLWKELLCPKEMETLRMVRGIAYSLRTSAACSESACDPYLVGVVPVLLSALLGETAKNLHAFDLSYSFPSNLEQATIAGMEALPVPSNAPDQELLLNLTSFLENMVSTLCCQLSVLVNEVDLTSHQYADEIIQWLVLLLNHCTRISSTWPMVSTLYRLCRLLTTLWDYALCSFHPSSAPVVDTASAPTSVSRERLEYDLCAYYSAVCRKIVTDFQHLELISVSLRMVYDAPTKLLLSLSLQNAIVPVVMLSLRSGIEAKRSLSMLTMLLDHDLLRDDILVDVIPILDMYLQSSTAGVDPSLTRSTKRNKSVIGKASRSGQDIMNRGAGEEDADGHAGIQLDVLRLLGRLGGRNKFILRNPSDIISSSLSWACFENELTLKLPVTFSDDSIRTQQSSQGGGSISLALGGCVPRIVELCMGNNADDRQIRVNAAECLHSLMLVLIGQSATDMATDGSQFVAMFEAVLPTILSLASSTEPVIRNLFDSLVTQLVHWLSTSGRPHSSSNGRHHLTDMALALQEAFLEGISRSSAGGNSQGRKADASYQDMCNRMIIEFYRWLQKTSPINGSQDESSPESLSCDNIINTLLLLSVHPSSEKRLGAANVLNKLYIFIREETPVVLKHSLRIIFTLLNAVKQVGTSQEVSLQPSICYGQRC